MPAGIRWVVRDRYGNDIYLTHERWEHIVAPVNHPDMAAYEEHLKETIRWGKRRQDSLNPHKYRYSQAFDDLVEDNTHIIAIVLFRLGTDPDGTLVSHNHIVTAYQKEIG